MRMQVDCRLTQGLGCPVLIDRVLPSIAELAHVLIAMLITTHPLWGQPLSPVLGGYGYRWWPRWMWRTGFIDGPDGLHRLQPPRSGGWVGMVLATACNCSRSTPSLAPVSFSHHDL